MSRVRSKVLSIILIFAIVFTQFTPIIGAEKSDITGHWAEKAIRSSVEEGIVVGFPDGAYRPNGNITRAEFIAFVNRKFNFTDEAEVTFPDVKDKWYKQDIAKAIAADYITGFKDGTMRPEMTITRQEVSVIIANILKLTENPDGANKYKDEIPAWSKGYIGAVTESGLMVGLTTDTFGAKKKTTRAEALVTLSRIDSLKTIYDTAGTFGPEKGTNTLSGTVTIDAEDVILQNTVIEGNLVISESVGEGDVTLSNVTVKGETIINGGGANSIHLHKSNFNKIIVNKDNVRVLSTDTSVNEITLNSGATLEAMHEELGFKNVIINAADDSKVILKGKFTVVTINSASNLELPANSSIKKITINKKVSITGEGTIEEARINANEVTSEIQPNKTVVKSGVKDPVINIPSSGNSGESNSDGSDTRPPVIDPPVIDPPIIEPPVIDPPIIDPPIIEPPVIDPPIIDPPAIDPPVEEEVVVASIDYLDVVETVSIGTEVNLPKTVQATMSDDTVSEKDIIWDGQANTDDVGTFEFIGVVERYNKQLTYDLIVEADGYKESEDGKTAYVSSQKGFEFAQEVITIEEIYIERDLQLPNVAKNDGEQEEITLPIIIKENGIKLDLNSNILDHVTILGSDVTLKNGEINSVRYNNIVDQNGEDIQLDAENFEELYANNVTLSNINDAPRTEHHLKGVGSLTLKGSTDLKGVLIIEDGLKLAGEDDGKVSGIVSIESIEVTDQQEQIKPVKLSVPVETVIVDVKNAVVNVESNVENMMVRQNATVNEAKPNLITNRNKLADVVVQLKTESEPESDIVEKEPQVMSMSTNIASEDGFKVALDRYDLMRYIGVAENFIEAADPGDLDGQFPEASIEKLKKATEAASKFITEPRLSEKNLDQTNIDNAVVVLNKALKKFGKSRIFLDTSSLRNKIRSVEQLLARTSIGDSLGQVPKEAHDNLKAILGRVQDEYTKAKTEGKVEELFTELSKGHETFESFYRELPSLSLTGGITFKLTDVDEEFIGNVEIKILSNKEKDEYSGLGHWTFKPDAKSLKLFDISGEVKNKTTVYYTIPTNKYIYTGSFTIDQYKKGQELELNIDTDKAVGTIAINKTSVDENFEIEVLAVEMVGSNHKDKWHHRYGITELTAIPVGKYIVQLKGFDHNSEYILVKTIDITSGENDVSFSNEEFKELLLDYSDKTGWDFQSFNYGSDLFANMQYSHVSDQRKLSNSLIVTKGTQRISVAYYADHKEQVGNQWRYDVSIPLSTEVVKEPIKTSPHFKFDLEYNEDFKELDTIDPETFFYNYFRTSIINEFGHSLTHLNFTENKRYLEYLGEITIKANGEEKSKTITRSWNYDLATVESIFPGAKGDIEITFSMKDGPFLIKTKTIKVKVAE